MSVYKRADCDVWWISVYGPDGRRKRFSSGTCDREKAEAVDASVRAALRGNVGRSSLIGVLDSLMGWEDDGRAGAEVSEIWRIYLQTVPRIGKDGLRRRKRLADAFVGWLADHSPEVRRLPEVTPRHAQAFADWLDHERGGSGKAQNNRVGHLKTLFNAVATRAGMDSNPFALVQRSDESDSQSGRAFDHDEEKRLLAVCLEHGADRRWFEASMLSRYSGLRLIDVAFLRAEDVGGGFISVMPSKTKRHGIRVQIPIHQRLVPVFDSLPESGWLFDRLHHHYETTKNGSGFSRMLELAEVEPRGAVLTFHCWRHTFRTRLAEAGVAQDVAMKLGGWTDAKTAEIYNHDLTRVEAAIRAMD